LIHIDVDPAEIGRNFPTELGVVADARLALEALAKAAVGRSHRSRGSLEAEIARARAEYVARFAAEWESDQFPMRPERILSELRKALPEDGIVVTDVGWNKNGVAQQFPITVPGTFITTSGLATMGFGPSAALGVKRALPDRPVVSLTGDGGFGANPSVVATAMEANLPVVWLIMDNAAFGTIAGLEQGQYDTTFGCVFLRNGEPYRVDWVQIAKGYGAEGIYVRSAGELGPALKKALASGLPTVIQAPMENAPTPTPGHWNIHDIYRRGE
jgi:acetolactate synthase-1/2/3 large subunit